jgi:hypothetical protein
MKANDNIVNFVEKLAEKNRNNGVIPSPWKKGNVIPSHVWLHSYSLNHGLQIEQLLPDILIERIHDLPNNPEGFRVARNVIDELLINPIPDQDVHKMRYMEAHVELLMSSGLIRQASDEQRELGLHAIVIYWRDEYKQLQLRMFQINEGEDLPEKKLLTRINLFMSDESEKSPFLSDLIESIPSQEELRD